MAPIWFETTQPSGAPLLQPCLLLLNRERQPLDLPIQQNWLSNKRLKCAVCFHPCPCGYHGDAEKTCTCSAAVVARYQKRISGPLLDRIDIHVDVPARELREAQWAALG